MASGALQSPFSWTCVAILPGGAPATWTRTFTPPSTSVNVAVPESLESLLAASGTSILRLDVDGVSGAVAGASAGGVAEPPQAARASGAIRNKAGPWSFIDDTFRISLEPPDRAATPVVSSRIQAVLDAGDGPCPGSAIRMAASRMPAGPLRRSWQERHSAANCTVRPCAPRRRTVIAIHEDTKSWFLPRWVHGAHTASRGRLLARENS